jgi:hypothetical protein
MPTKIFRWVKSADSASRRPYPGLTLTEEEGIPESNRQVANSGPFPSVPLTIVAATDHGPYFKKWEPTLMQLQQQLATLFPAGHSSCRER